ncbi:hypothetical protein FTX61_16035 [Nitriliruptoraceae bacterium ZYF776]|nr:hypothetical protein [Profundirhabdus halotolerans]
MRRRRHRVTRPACCGGSGTCPEPPCTVVTIATVGAAEHPVRRGVPRCLLGRRHRDVDVDRREVPPSPTPHGLAPVPPPCAVAVDVADRAPRCQRMPAPSSPARRRRVGVAPTAQPRRASRHRGRGASPWVTRPCTIVRTQGAPRGSSAA